jgi:Bacterial inner membrane protein
MSPIGIEYLGWEATAVFVGSYFCARPALLRGVQMCGALLWVIYGVLIGASPVIVANVLVLSAAAWTLIRRAPANQSDGGPL